MIHEAIVQSAETRAGRERDVGNIQRAQKVGDRVAAPLGNALPGGCLARRVVHRPNAVASSPAMPKPNAANASPAIKPPPTSDVVFMSSGSAAPSVLRLGRLLSRLESAPPAANQPDVARLRNPPKDDA